jgi:hypothetical protein
MVLVFRRMVLLIWRRLPPLTGGLEGPRPSNRVQGRPSGPQHPVSALRVPSSASFLMPRKRLPFRAAFSSRKEAANAASERRGLRQNAQRFAPGGALRGRAPLEG